MYREQSNLEATFFGKRMHADKVSYIVNFHSNRQRP